MDFFNYSPTLPILTPASPAPATTYHSSNLYYKAAASITGSHTWSITLPTDVLMNVIIR
jgi:hypothetical protein